jgi:tRNA (cytidine32/uridine32-2'-O)-methyltransferase
MVFLDINAYLVSKDIKTLVYSPFINEQEALMLDHIRIVLVNTSHPGNIGAAARAMMNMGLSQLYLVTPQRFPHAEATARASGATGILKNAVVCGSLAEAVAECTLVFAASARSRTLEWPMCAPSECAHKAVQAVDQKVALVFGNERIGLTNDELVLAHEHVCIPTVEKFSSLNLAQAVQVLVYELFKVASSNMPPIAVSARQPASQAQVQGYLKHLEKLLYDVRFLDPKHPKLLMKRLTRLYYRAELDETEVNILRGIISAVEKKIV